MRADRVIEQLRAMLLRDGAGLTDGQLLECFLVGRENAAFEALVRRHGPMVLSVCRRILRNHHDSEDAFQATFLVLARKAAAVVPRENVGNWLHGVAYRTALKARALAAKRRERQVLELPEPEASPDESGHELECLLDRELRCLPEKYRAPLVLCGLEGKTEKEAARLLGWPQGTLSGRLSRARTMLARRLARHGLVLSLGTILSPDTASACVSHSVLESTITAARLYAAGRALGTGPVSAKVITLTEGVLTAMLFSKLKVMLVFLSWFAAGFGAGIWAYGPHAAEPPANQVPADRNAFAQVPPSKKELPPDQVETERQRRQRDLDTETEHLRSIFRAQEIDVFIDTFQGDPRTPYLKGMRFSKVLDVGGKRFFEFIRVSKAGTAERLLIDPVRVIGYQIKD